RVDDSHELVAEKADDDRDGEVGELAQLTAELHARRAWYTTRPGSTVVEKGMAEGPDAQRLQEIFTALVQRNIAESLARVEEALAKWRKGERTVLSAHAEVLRHTARTNILSNRVARAALEGPETLLRDALDAGVIARPECEKLAGRDPDTIAPS